MLVHVEKLEKRSAIPNNHAALLPNVKGQMSSCISRQKKINPWPSTSIKSSPSLSSETAQLKLPQMVPERPSNNINRNIDNSCNQNNGLSVNVINAPTNHHQQHPRFKHIFYVPPISPDKRSSPEKSVTPPFTITAPTSTITHTCKYKGEEVISPPNDQRVLEVRNKSEMRQDRKRPDDFMDCPCPNKMPDRGKNHSSQKSEIQAANFRKDPTFLMKNILADKVVPQKTRELPKRPSYQNSLNQPQPFQVKPVVTPTIKSPVTASPTIKATASPFLPPQTITSDKNNPPNPTNNIKKLSKIKNPYVPLGKLCYIKTTNTLLRYFDDVQQRLFFNNVTQENGKSNDNVTSKNCGEVIQLPSDMMFNPKERLSVEEYIAEMNFVEKFVPRDFYNFYKFVTGYQICNDNLPVSFLTFLRFHNTNGLSTLHERYLKSLQEDTTSVPTGN